MNIKFQSDFLKKALFLAQSYDYVAYYDNHGYRDNQVKSAFDKLLAFGARELFSTKEIGAFDAFELFANENKEWLFGFFSYELKNDIERLSSKGLDYVKFPAITFFMPEYIFIEKENSIEFLSFSDGDADLIAKIESLKIPKSNLAGIELLGRISHTEYINTIQKIKEHIYRGDIYEMNYCVEYYNDNADINPFFVYQKLCSLSPTPFSTFLKFEDKFLLSSSPERYLKKKAIKIVSQPIKGTIKRGENSKEDILFRKILKNSEKDRAENIMIVDLVRNDLSRIAKKASVNVDELCGIYAYPKVFQMISTISAELDKKQSFLNVIKATFPPGSMTGAPKVRAMKLIEKYENVKRGLYSGVVGYITPGRDFDFNVVIRSILYNAKNAYLSVMVGGAITALSDAEAEYEECLLKAEAMKQALE